MNHAYRIPADYLQKSGFLTPSGSAAWSRRQSGERLGAHARADWRRHRTMTRAFWSLALIVAALPLGAGRFVAAPAALSPAAQVGQGAVLRSDPSPRPGECRAPPVTTRRTRTDRPTISPCSREARRCATAARGRYRRCAISEYTPPYSDLLDNPDGISKPGPGGGLTLDGRAPTLADQARIPLLAAQRDGEPRRSGCRRQDHGRVVRARVRRRVRRSIFSGHRHARFARRSRRCRRFSSRTTAFIPTPANTIGTPATRSAASLTPQERRGFAVYNDPKKGNCFACHYNGAGLNGSRAALHGLHVCGDWRAAQHGHPGQSRSALLRSRPLRPARSSAAGTARSTAGCSRRRRCATSRSARCSSTTAR